MRSRILRVLEAVLWLAFLADILLLAIATIRTGNAESPGFASLIVIVLVLAGIHRLRTGQSFGDDQ